jgi:hypothetical protein
MAQIEECKRIVDIELEKCGFSVCGVDAVLSTSGQIIARITTHDGRTADGTQEMTLDAIWQAEHDGVSLEEVFTNRNMYAPSI